MKPGDAILQRGHGSRFTTRDKDNDEKVTNCADDHTGAFWYVSCMIANPMGKYYTGKQNL